MTEFGILKAEVLFLRPSLESSIGVPVFLSPVEAGFPSPADDYIEDVLDLNKYLIKKPAATFIVKVKGDSMKDAGIDPGDLLIIDRSLNATHKSIVVAMLNGAFTVKRLIKKNGQTFLRPENSKYKEIKIEEGFEFEIWGVVAHVIKSFQQVRK